MNSSKRARQEPQTLRPPTAFLSLVVVRYGESERSFAAGEAIIGRSTECDFVVDDPLVSRRHARLTISPTAIWIEDLSSANGVFVREERIRAPHKLEGGEIVLLGGAEVWIRRVRRPESGPHPSDKHPPRKSGDFVRPSTVAETTASRADGWFDGESANATRRANMFELIGDIVDKSIAVGRFEDAERVVTPHLQAYRTKALSGETIPAETLEWSVKQALHLATATAKGAWVDYCVESYVLAERTMPATVVDELYSVVRVARPIDVVLLRRYVALLASMEGTVGPGDRFLAGRIAGLERVILSG